MLRGDGRLPPVVALALLAVAMPPTHGGGGDGQSPASCDPDAGACAAGVAQRRLLAAGWDEVLAVRAPQFVELVPAVDQGAPGSFVQRRRFVHPGCADRPEWRFMWPTSLAEGFTCDDYAAGRINNDHCDSDVGFEFESGTWVLAMCITCPDTQICICACICACVCVWMQFPQSGTRTTVRQGVCRPPLLTVTVPVRGHVRVYVCVCARARARAGISVRACTRTHVSAYA